MGVSMYDHAAAHRAAEAMYAFEYAHGVEMLLRNMTALCARKWERGDITACDLLIDLERAIELARLSTQEKEVIHALYIDDNHHTDVVIELKMARSTMYRIADSACEKIAAVYRSWGYGSMLIRETGETT